MNKGEKTVSSSEGEECRRCGECCRYANYIIVRDEDLKRLAQVIEQRQLKVLSGKPLSLLQVGERCCFFDDSSGAATCAIYEDRPLACRRFCCGGEER